MPKRKQTAKPKQAAAEDLLLRALRKAAEEVLEESVPERLLEVIQAARRRGADGQPAAPPAEPARPDEPG
jgi:hypothetical protein